MKALIVINSFSKEKANLNKANRLKEELEKKGVEADIRKASSLLFSSFGDQISLDLKEYSFCFYLDKDAYLARVISYQIPLFNSYESLLLSDDKMHSILALRNSGVKVPETISAPLCYVDDPDSNIVDEFLLSVEERLSYPLVFKQVHGSLGRQVKLVSNREELRKTYLENKKQPHLYEEYIERKPAYDYRLIVIGEKAVASIKRVNENDFRSNIALGGVGFDVTNKLPTEFEKTAISAAKVLKLDYAGIDLLSKDGEPLFIEANGNAFFEETEKVTKVNIAEALVTHALIKLKLN